jgi:hypothetical protein
MDFKGIKISLGENNNPPIFVNNLKFVCISLKTSEEAKMK